MTICHAVGYKATVSLASKILNPRGRLGQPLLSRFTDWQSGIKKGRALGPSSRDGFCLGLESVVERRHDVLALGKPGLETVVPVATVL